MKLFMHLTHLKRTPLLIWVSAVIAFYIFWLGLVTYQGLWVKLSDYWPIMVSMAFGSYAAGATPMGGGSVGFPILVFLFDQPTTVGRDFSFAIQSVGMVSATIFILCRKQAINIPIIKGAMVGICLSLPVGLSFISPIVNGVWPKYIFAIIWVSFGLLHIYRLSEMCAHDIQRPYSYVTFFNTGLTLGALSGLLIVSVTGVGVDMLIYTALMLYFRCDLKVAIPTSVIIMAFTSVIGITYRALFQTVEPNTYINWLAAAPIVILGAPLGALIVEKVGRKITLLCLSFLCIAQFIWVNYIEYDAIGLKGMAFAFMAVTVCLISFEKIRKLGINNVRL